MLVGSAAAALAIPAGAGAATKITVLSNRADLVSGKSALVRIHVPARSGGSEPALRLNGASIHPRLQRSGGGFIGLVKGLHRGRNELTATLPDGSGASLRVIDHPNGGPVFSGPQLQPWTCEDGARNAKCDKRPTFSYLYKSTDSNKKDLQPYDPANPPGDVATTTTENGKTVPFIVRLETGYENRDQYKIATLFEPGKPWSALHPQPQFNHKLLVTHGASCDIDYEVGNAPSVTKFNPADLLGLPVGIPTGALADGAQYALGKGFVVMSTALDNSGHNCNVVTQAESVLSAKEHVIERYGRLKFTIGTGCSGGSLAQQWIANAYPGIYQGILPTCSFPDAWSSATQVMDYHLLRTYLEDPSRWGSGIAWSPTQFAPVEGSVAHVNAIASDLGFFDAIVPTHNCGGISDAQRYDPQYNPDGVRCSIADAAINIFGPQPKKRWGPIERSLGRGFAGVGVDNVGVQYGLEALRNLQITPAQFVDLNAKIGGLSIDIQPTKKRIQADRPALRRAYRSGMINEANNLDRTAIIDCRGPDPGAAHDSYRAFAMRDRLDRENGTHANQSIWEGPTLIIGDTKCNQTSLAAMNDWLAAVRRDHSSRPLAAKIIADKPADAGDQCWSGIGVRLTSGLCPPGIVPVYGTPRTVAGDALTTDTNKCQLKPLRRSDYTATFSDAEWATLQATFPKGVCDFSKPGVDQRPTVPWQTYQDAHGQVIYGGEPMGRPPHSKPF